MFLGQESTPKKALMQVPGAVLRMPVEVFRRYVVDVPESRLQHLLQRHTHVLMVQMAQGQGVACDWLHSVEQHAARGLLTTRDRVGEPPYPLTQEFLAMLPGVRRACVSEVAAGLLEEGLIGYTRGIITNLDPSGLEARTYICYRIIRDEFDRMLSSF
ncbi:MAG TPA: helix-turn-helix domain-containing protein [Ktedonobacterales bacterium]|nr:helix-turn-helix domain-containing protein [Ktedonobacterales bacterium]